MAIAAPVCIAMGINSKKSFFSRFFFNDFRTIGIKLKKDSFHGAHRQSKGYRQLPTSLIAYT